VGLEQLDAIAERVLHIDTVVSRQRFVGPHIHACFQQAAERGSERRR
jgi:hypothetical protein